MIVREGICRASQYVLRWFLRLVPMDLHEWGNAMLAELEAIEDPVESLRWSSGCLAVILRRVFISECLGVYRGAGLWIMAKEEGVGTRNVRIAAVLAVAAALGFFIAPSFREAMSIDGVIVDGLWGNQSSARETGDRPRVAAEQQGNAEMLAYLAIHEKRIEIAQEEADRAIAIDPRWTWVYYNLACREIRGSSDRQPFSQSALWIKRLHRWDPQNAVPYLLEAERLVRVQAVGFERNRDQRILQNKAWVAAMAGGFDAPEYSSYVQQVFDLDKDVARQRGSINPLRFAVEMLTRPVSPGISRNLRLYEKSILNSAKDDEKNNDRSDRIQQAKRVIAFGELMVSADSMFEAAVGREIALDGYQYLQPLAAPADQLLMAARAAQLKSMKLGEVRSQLVLSRVPVSPLVVNATIVEVCFILMVIAMMTICALVGISVFRHAPVSRKINLVFYAAAVTMLLACLASYIAYLPYSHVMAQVMDPKTPVRVGGPLLVKFASFALAARPEWFVIGKARVYGWITVLAVLSFLMLWILLRQLRRSGPRPPVVALR